MYHNNCKSSVQQPVIPAYRSQWPQWSRQGLLQLLSEISQSKKYHIHSLSISILRHNSAYEANCSFLLTSMPSKYLTSSMRWQWLRTMGREKCHTMLLEGKLTECLRAARSALSPQQVAQKQYSSRMTLFSAIRTPLSMQTYACQSVLVAIMLNRYIAISECTTLLLKAEAAMYQSRIPYLIIIIPQSLHAARFPKKINAFCTSFLENADYNCGERSGRNADERTEPKLGRKLPMTPAAYSFDEINFRVAKSGPLNALNMNQSTHPLVSLCVLVSLSRSTRQEIIFDLLSSSVMAENVCILRMFSRTRVTMAMSGYSTVQWPRRTSSLVRMSKMLLTVRETFSQPSIVAVKLAKTSKIVGRIEMRSCWQWETQKRKFLKLASRTHSDRTNAIDFHSSDISVSWLVRIYSTSFMQNSSGSLPSKFAPHSIARATIYFASEWTRALGPVLLPN